MVMDENEKSDIFGRFFSSVFVKEPEWTWILDHEEKSRIIKELELTITKEIITKKLHDLNINKSPGTDNLHPKIFKELAQVIVEPLFIILNLSIQLNKTPAAWKSASITPIYKNKGDKDITENYRPVILTSIACKIMESIVRDAMLDYLKSNGIPTNKQFGFLSGRSTVLQLLMVMDKWTKILDKGGVIDVIYCDFQNAFDTVPHKRLIELPAHYGLSNPVLS